MIVYSTVDLIIIIKFYLLREFEPYVSLYNRKKVATPIAVKFKHFEPHKRWNHENIFKKHDISPTLPHFL